MLTTSNLDPQKAVRWMDFSAYGMKLKNIGFDNGQALILEGGDNNPFVADKLGFSKIDDDWLAPCRIVAPNIVKLVAPEARVMTVMVGDVTVFRGGKMPSIPVVPTKLAASAIEQVPLELRWIDLSQHGLSVKRVFDDGGFAFHEFVGDVAQEAAERLGFSQGEDGTWINRDAHLDPRKFKAVFPHSQVVYTHRDEVVEDRRSDFLKSPNPVSAPSPK
ncbi:hypothetical protein HFO56_00315 [Rhizobium laguerreae]|uniref:hypothetical protein n=1 Tax=Rhizobium laguerreae TaxID=1076926 RepID=UPI001C900524|nr:hypothetical protein [Rhizobium laguerreae]MBY3150872.1 hypothetical protein [Rhizobium laguerreae]